MICLSDSLKKSIIEKLNSFWPHIFSNKLPKNRNEILFCTSQDQDSIFAKKPFNDKNENLNNKDGNAMSLLSEISKSFKEINNNE